MPDEHRLLPDPRSPLYSPVHRWQVLTQSASILPGREYLFSVFGTTKAEGDCAPFREVALELDWR
jgi:hypothetical protein